MTMIDANKTIIEFLDKMDDCLDGIPEEEKNLESELGKRARSLDASIRRKLKEAGIDPESLGPDVLPGLEREFSSAEQKHSTGTTQVQDVKHQIDAVREEIRKLDDAMKKNQAAQDRLTRNILDLERQIDERSLFAKIWYWLFTDEQKAQLQADRNRYDALQGDLAVLRTEMLGKKSNRDNLADRLASLTDMVRKYKIMSSECDARKNAFCEARQLAKEHESVVQEKTQLKQMQEERRNNQKLMWGTVAQGLKAYVGGIRERQPRLTEIGHGVLGSADVFPDVIQFGTLRFNAGGNMIGVPRILPFPVPFAMHFPTTSAGTNFAREFILRAFQCTPSESLEITVCDPVHMGASMEGFQSMLDNRKPFPERSFLTSAKDVENALGRIHSEIANFLQKDCSGEIRDWTSYNVAHPGNPKVYRLLVMFDMDDQLTDVAATYLVKIIENGPKCGILPLLGCDPGKLDPRRRKALCDALKSFSVSAENLRGYLQYPKFRNLSVAGEIPSDIPDVTRTAELLRPLADSYAKRDRFAGTFESLWEDEPFWGVSSADGIEAPIGWHEDDRSRKVRFSIGQHSRAVHHALLGGKSGSGKSNLIHVLLHSLCHRYSPNELSLYLLDYKESIEFNGYANPLLPHAAGIATESDVEYGLSVLRHLENEMKRRAEIFKDNGVRDLYEYRTKTGGAMPRALLVVDEFQRLFETSKEGGEAERLLGNLLRQGRSAGIHLLLATQTMHGFQNLSSSRSLLPQISCRIALACTPEDSATLLQQDNLEASALASPPQGIFNDDLGVKSANVKFIIPEAAAEVRKAHLEALYRASKGSTGVLQDCHVFSGASLPVRPSCDVFTDMCGVTESQLLVGRTADFEEAPVLADVSGKNLLVVGRTKGMSGLKESIAESLRAMPGRKSFLIYTDRSDMWSALDGTDCTVQNVGDEWDGAGLEEFAHGESEHKFVILDGFENLKALHSSGFSSLRGGPSPAERLRSLVERPQKSGVQLVMCFRDYSRAFSTAKELLAVCEVRIGDGSIVDMAKFVEFDAPGARCNIELGAMKAVLVNRDADAPVVFRPFGI